MFVTALFILIQCSRSESLPDFSSSNTGPYVFNIEQLELIRDNLDKPEYQQEYEILISGADELLQDDSFEFVGEKSELPPSGNPNDYMSIARYSGGSDGVTNPMIYDYDRPKLARMSSAVYTLSLAYYFSGNEDYAKKASDLLYGWFMDESTRMNPNMQYAQVDPFSEDEHNPRQGIIDANDFIIVIEAVSLLYGSHWPPNYHIHLKKWFYEFSIWMINNYGANAYSTTNVSTWMDVQRAIFFMFTEQEDRVNSNYYIPPITERIETQIEPNGIQTNELTRARQRHYEYFNLRAYMNLVMIRKNNTGHDRDWPSLNTGQYGGLKPALDLVMNDIHKPDEMRTLLDNNDFDTCRYLEIFKPAAIAFESAEYDKTARLLIENGCSNPDITLVFPPLELLEHQTEFEIN